MFIFVIGIHFIQSMQATSRYGFKRKRRKQRQKAFMSSKIKVAF